MKEKIHTQYILSEGIPAEGDSSKGGEIIFLKVDNIWKRKQSITSIFMNQETVVLSVVWKEAYKVMTPN